MTTPAFELNSSRAADILIVEVAGEVDMATAPQLAEAVEGASGPCRRVVVDLSEVTFLDSSGLRAIPMVDPDVSHSVGLVVPDREPLTPSARQLVHLAGRDDVLSGVERAASVGGAPAPR